MVKPYSFMVYLGVYRAQAVALVYFCVVGTTV